MFEAFTKGLAEAFGDLGTTAKKFVGKRSMDRMAAVAAMVSYLPDKDADDDEIHRAVRAIFAVSEGLYTVEEINTSIQSHLKTLKFDDEIGKVQLMNEIRPANGTGEAPLLIACAIAVGKASGPSPDVDPFTPEERALTAEIAEHLGEDPSKYPIIKK